MYAKGRASVGDRHYLRRDPARSPKGERHGRAKLTDREARAIKIAALAGHPDDELAARYGVVAHTIRRIRLGSHWRHISV